MPDPRYILPLAGRYGKCNLPFFLGEMGKINDLRAKKFGFDVFGFHELRCGDDSLDWRLPKKQSNTIPHFQKQNVAARGLRASLAKRRVRRKAGERPASAALLTGIDRSDNVSATRILRAAGRGRLPPDRREGKSNDAAQFD